MIYNKWTNELLGSYFTYIRFINIACILVSLVLIEVTNVTLIPSNKTNKRKQGPRNAIPTNNHRPTRGNKAIRQTPQRHIVERSAERLGHKQYYIN